MFTDDKFAQCLSLNETPDYLSRFTDEDIKEFYGCLQRFLICPPAHRTIKEAEFMAYME